MAFIWPLLPAATKVSVILVGAYYTMFGMGNEPAPDASGTSPMTGAQKVTLAIRNDPQIKNDIARAEPGMKKEILQKVAHSLGINLSEAEVTAILTDLAAENAVYKQAVGDIPRRSRL